MVFDEFVIVTTAVVKLTDSLKLFVLRRTISITFLISVSSL